MSRNVSLAFHYLQMSQSIIHVLLTKNPSRNLLYGVGLQPGSARHGVGVTAPNGNPFQQRCINFHSFGSHRRGERRRERAGRGGGMERESLSKQRAACPRVYSDTLFGPSSNRLICSPLLTVDSDGVVSPPEPFSRKSAECLLNDGTNDKAFGFTSLTHVELSFD